jgi:RNase H-fold protein (predicted Holliday junction resolvase)
VECVFIGAPFRRAHDLEQRQARVKSFAEQLTALTGVKVILADATSDSG